MTSSAPILLKTQTRNCKEGGTMKLIGNKEKGYKLVSSYEVEKPKKPEKPGKPEKPANTDKPPEGGTTDPDKGGKEE